MRTIDNTQRITLDIRDNQTYEQIYIKQYNKGFPIEFEITKNGEPFDLSGCFATFEMKKPDKTVIWYNCDISDNILSVEVTEQMTIVNGKAEFQITLNQGEILITTITGIMKIDKSVIQDGDVDSSSDISIVNEVLLEIKEVKQLVADAKTYKESAETSASSASTSASNAKISETNAKISETNSAQNMATTKTYMESASDSASSALESAQNALDSASQAELSMENAVQSEVNAKTSETNSANSAILAESYASGVTGSAKYYYEQAKSISESFSGALKPMGTVTFANLPNITSATEGDMYNISDEFTTTDEFKEGGGNVIPAGSNIYKTTDGYWDVLAGSPVTGVKGNVETTYRRGNVNITPENIGALAIDGDSSDNITSFESGDGEGDKYVEVPTMSSGETHKSLFAKISTMFKNIRYLFKILGTTNISALGDGTVTGNINTLNYNYNYLNARLGKPAKYSRVSTYSVGDYCMYMDCIYKCIVDVTTPGDFDSSYWEVTDVCNEVDVLKDDVSVLNSNLSYKGGYTGNIDELLGISKCGGYIVVVSTASGTQPFDNASYYLELPTQGYGNSQKAVHITTGEVKERFYRDSQWYPWTNTKANAPIKISSTTEIPPSESIAIRYDNSITYSTCDIMFYAYDGYRQSIKLAVINSSAGSNVPFFKSATEVDTFKAVFLDGALTITNQSTTQKVVITHIYLNP